MSFTLFLVNDTIASFNSLYFQTNLMDEVSYKKVVTLDQANDVQNVWLDNGKNDYDKKLLTKLE